MRSRRQGRLQVLTAWSAACKSRNEVGLERRLDFQGRVWMCVVLQYLQPIALCDVINHTHTATQPVAHASRHTSFIRSTRTRQQHTLEISPITLFSCSHAASFAASASACSFLRTWSLHMWWWSTGGRAGGVSWMRGQSTHVCSAA